MSKRVQNTTFISRGRIAGLVRDESPGRDRPEPDHPHRQPRLGPAAAADEALFYRARLILGDALPRPNR